MSETEGDRRGEYIAASLAIEGLEDMSADFLPHRSSWCRGLEDVEHDLGGEGGEILDV